MGTTAWELGSAVVLLSLAAYAAAGLLFALVFLARGVRVVDPATRSAGWGFRLLILPGLVMLWPWLAARWRRAGRAATDAGAHA